MADVVIRRMMAKTREMLDELESELGFRVVMVPVDLARELEARGLLVRDDLGGWRLEGQLAPDVDAGS